MMRQLKPNVYAVGAIDWDARLFDRLIPLPDGTTYNSYLIKGSEKTALLDTVDPSKTDVLIDNLSKAGVNKLDYSLLIMQSRTIPVHCRIYWLSIWMPR